MKTVGYHVSEIGFPEVDKVIQGSLFGRLKWKKNSLNLLQRCQNFQIQSPKFQRLSKEKKIIEEDRISRLPDEILEFIISLLTMREGAATSILSKRWTNLWSRSASCFAFDLYNMIGYNYISNSDANSQTVDRLRNDTEFLTRERLRFTEWVDRVSQLCRASKINALRIAFVLGKESASHIDRWVTYAANRGLTDLELDFQLLFVRLCSSIAYEFPFQLYGLLKYLRLNSCNFNCPPNFKGFNSLISLTLRNSFITNHGLQNLLSNSSSLKCLNLLYCTFDEYIDNLKFSGPSLPLKHLRLRLKALDLVAKVEVHDVNLMSLEFTGFCTKLSIKNTPHLAKLVLCTGKPVDFLSDIPRLETLFVAAVSSVKENILPDLYIFKNLKQLVFLSNEDITNFLEVIRFLQACPLLQKLELDMGIYGVVVTTRLAMNPTNISARHGVLHKNLKEVEIYGFQDHPEKIEIIQYMLRNSVVLEKMEMFSYSKTYLGEGEWFLCETTMTETRVSMEKVRKLLQKEACPSTKLILCPDTNFFPLCTL